MKIKILLVLVFVFVGLVTFFFPKPSSSYPTEFSIQQKIGQGMSEREARMKAQWEVTTCTCIGLENESKVTSYKIENVCYGIVTGCRKTK